MTTVNVSGWSKDIGAYDVDVPFDDSRTDMEITFKDGETYRQESRFATEAHDWNNDGDTYPMFGAWFRNQQGRGEFFTPEVMMRMVMDGEAKVSGMNNPLEPLRKQARR